MIESYTEFIDNFRGEIKAEAHAQEMLREHAFVEKMGEILIEYGEINDLVECPWQDRGYKIDAYDIDDEYSSLTLIVSHWLDDSDPEGSKVANSEIKKIFDRASNFFEKSREGKLQHKIDISNAAHDLAAMINECRKDILSVKIILVTDGITKERKAEVQILDGVEIIGVIWDVTRVQSFLKTGEREKITIDFESDYGGQSHV